NSPAAGGIVDQKTIERAQDKGLDYFSFLDRNDSYSFLNQTESVIITGSTGTNVSDFILMLVS
ncbi:MAG: glycerate kinase, partial [Candidatus Heimdallarchaeota archaeon]|nr:glycerate kinase [Candidatus Heimdallarchaeota archaeon]MCK5049358.1 glycerate kinase [Candidatus Heimdallarchaeota archaeon]